MRRKNGKGLDHRADDGGEAPVVSRSAGERDPPKAKPRKRKTQHSRRGPPENVLLAQLRRLLRHRRGADNLSGGLDAEIFATLGHYSLSSLSAEKRGQLWQVTHEDRLRFDMRNFAPVDESRAYVRAFAAMIKGHNDYLRKRKRRAAERERKAGLSKLGDLDVREEDLFAATDEQWRTISDLMHDIGGHASWRGLSGGSLRRVMNRAAVALVRKEMIEQKNEQGAKGQPVRLIRRVLNTATKKEAKL